MLRLGAGSSTLFFSDIVDGLVPREEFESRFLYVQAGILDAVLLVLAVGAIWLSVANVSLEDALVRLTLELFQTARSRSRSKCWRSNRLTLSSPKHFIADGGNVARVSPLCLLSTPKIMLIPWVSMMSHRWIYFLTWECHNNRRSPDR